MYTVSFTDIEMPLMDGHRLTKLIKEDDELKKIPVVIFSSLVNEESVERRGIRSRCTVNKTRDRSFSGSYRPFDRSVQIVIQ